MCFPFSWESTYNIRVGAKFLWNSFRFVFDASSVAYHLWNLYFYFFRKLVKLLRSITEGLHFVHENEQPLIYVLDVCSHCEASVTAKDSSLRSLYFTEITEDIFWSINISISIFTSCFVTLLNRKYTWQINVIYNAILYYINQLSAVPRRILYCGPHESEGISI